MKSLPSLGPGLLFIGQFSGAMTWLKSRTYLGIATMPHLAKQQGIMIYLVLQFEDPSLSSPLKLMFWMSCLLKHSNSKDFLWPSREASSVFSGFLNPGTVGESYSSETLSFFIVYVLRLIPQVTLTL